MLTTSVGSIQVQYQFTLINTLRLFPGKATENLPLLDNGKGKPKEIHLLTESSEGTKLAKDS